jgi:hypothetical protein
MSARVMLLAVVGCLALTQSALAQDRAAARKACMSDFKAHCAGVTPGGGRVAKCLNDNLAKLTPDCRAALLAHKQDKAKGAQ